MTKRTRLFLFGAAGILVIGLGTGLVASYVGVQNLVIGGNGPAELAYVPADTRVVAFANVREVMDSELRQKVMQLTGRKTLGTDGDSFRAETGIDIERDVDQVIAAIAGEGTEQGPPLVLARGRFDEVRIEGIVREKGGVVEDYKGTRMLTHADSSTGVAFVEPGLVAVGSASAVRRAIDTKASGDDVRSNVDLMRLVRDNDDGNAWAVARFDALTAAGTLPPELASQLPAISWFSVSSHVNGGLRGVVRAETRDEAAAQDLRQVIQGFVALARMQTRDHAQFAGLLDSLQLGGDGKTVSLAFSVPSEIIDTLGAFTARRRPPPAVPNAPEPRLERQRQPTVPSL